MLMFTTINADVYEFTLNVDVDNFSTQGCRPRYVCAPAEDLGAGDSGRAGGKGADKPGNYANHVRLEIREKRYKRYKRYKR